MHVVEEMDGRVQEYEMVVEDLEEGERRWEGAERGLKEGEKEMVEQEKKLRIVGKCVVYCCVISLCFAEYSLDPVLNPPASAQCA